MRLGRRQTPESLRLPVLRVTARGDTSFPFPSSPVQCPCAPGARASALPQHMHWQGDESNPPPLLWAFCFCVRAARLSPLLMPVCPPWFLPCVFRAPDYIPTAPKAEPTDSPPRTDHHLTATGQVKKRGATTPSAPEAEPTRPPTLQRVEPRREPAAY